MSTISVIGSGDMAAEQVGAGATTGAFGAAPAGGIVILAVPYSAVLEHACLLSLGLVAHSITRTNFSIGVSHLG